jgi:hypothetical protein
MAPMPPRRSMKKELMTKPVRIFVFILKFFIAVRRLSFGKSHALHSPVRPSWLIAATIPKPYDRLFDFNLLI